MIVLFQRTTGDEIKVPLESPYGSLEMSLDSNGRLKFENSSKQFVLLEQFDIII